MCFDAREYFIDRTHRFILYFNWKVATFSLRQWLYSNFPHGEYRLCDEPLKEQRVSCPDCYVKVMAIRGSPISRFQSAITTILDRSSDKYAEDTGVKNALNVVVLMNNVLMATGLARGLSEAEVHKGFPYNLVETYVQHADCVPKYLWWQHFASQSHFAAKQHLFPRKKKGNPSANLQQQLHQQQQESSSAGEGLDLVLRLESLQDDVETKLLPRIGLSIEDLSQRFVVPINTGGRSVNELVAAPQWKDRTIIRKLCSIYMQDYICFDLVLPEECSDLLDDE